MYYGYTSMATLPFLTIGFVWVMVVCGGFGAAFFVGSRSGGRAAERFIKRWTSVSTLGAAAIIGWALLDGQLQAFFKSFGVGPFIEIGVLAFGLIGIMWFMAVQYANGRIALDETFGSKQVRDEAKRQAIQAQQEHYVRAHEHANKDEE